MTEKQDKVEPIKVDLEAQIKEKMAGLPGAQQGWTPEQMAQMMKDGQSSTLTERSIDDFLKIFKSDKQGVIDLMTLLDDDQLIDLHDAHMVNDMFYKRFCSDEKQIDKFTVFINGVARRFVSHNGRGLEVYENIAAGRAPGDVGLFRGIFGALSRKLFKDDEKKI